MLYYCSACAIATLSAANVNRGALLSAAIRVVTEGHAATWHDPALSHRDLRDNRVRVGMSGVRPHRLWQRYTICSLATSIVPRVALPLAAHLHAGVGRPYKMSLRISMSVHCLQCGTSASSSRAGTCRSEIADDEIKIQQKC